RSDEAKPLQCQSADSLDRSVGQTCAGDRGVIALAVLLLTLAPATEVPVDTAVGPLRLVVDFDGGTSSAAMPEVRWKTFLDRLFAHFDRDADGVLSRDEAARLIALPDGSPRGVPFHCDGA